MTKPASFPLPARWEHVFRPTFFKRNTHSGAHVPVPTDEIGEITVIYDSRPNGTIQLFSSTVKNDDKNFDHNKHGVRLFVETPDGHTTFMQNKDNMTIKLLEATLGLYQGGGYSLGDSTGTSITLLVKRD